MVFGKLVNYEIKLTELVFWSKVISFLGDIHLTEPGNYQGVWTCLVNLKIRAKGILGGGVQSTFFPLIWEH